MKAKYLKLILLVLMMLPSAMSNAQTQVVTNAGTLDEALKFLYDNMVYVEGGTYLKGESQVSTTVGSFYCCRYETLYWLWRHVMDDRQDEDMGDMAPIMGPTWDRFQEFIAKLNRYAGIKYRLLTDDEWEYAARGGKLSKGYLYAGSNIIDDVAWYKDNWGNQPLIVGRKQPNELGLYDMSGNAEEWCQDTVPSANNARRRTPIVDVDSLSGVDEVGVGKHRYVRGGSLFSIAAGCTVYAYYGYASDLSWPTIGCRLALDISEYDKLKPVKFRIGLKGDEANSVIDHEPDHIKYDPQTNKFILPPFDESGGATGTELDIAQVDYISRATVSNLRLPESTTTENIVLRGDDEDIEMGEDGSFESEAGTLIAYNNDNLMYLNLSPGRFKGQKIALNGLETAASMIIMLFPDAYQKMSLENFTLFKIALAQLQETKDLGAAIDKIVAAKGYFEVADVQNEYDAVLARLLQLANVDTSTTNNRPLRRAPREPAFYDPGFTPERVNKMHGNGFFVELNNSTWLPEGTEKEQKPLWQCEFTVYNGGRYCYMFVMDGFTANDGLKYASSSNVADYFRYIVKPQGISKLMDFGSISDIGQMEFLTKPIESFTDADLSKVEQMFKETLPLWGSILKGESYDTTWDKVKKSGIKLNFDESENQLLVLGPKYNTWMMVYNIMMKFVFPVLKWYKGYRKLDRDPIEQIDLNQGGTFEAEIGEAEDDDDSYFVVEYFKDLGESDVDLYIEMERDLADGVTLKEFLKKYGEKLMTSFIKFLAKKGDELIAEKTLQKGTREFIKKLSGHVPVVEEITQIFKVVGLVFSGCDITLGILDWNYLGTSFQMQFDFNKPTGSIDPIPGEDL